MPNLIRLYRITEEYFDNEPSTYVGTLAEVRAWLKDMAPLDRTQLTVAECQLTSDKQGLMDALNGKAKPFIKRQWRGTARGGLKQTHDHNGRL